MVVRLIESRAERFEIRQRLFGRQLARVVLTTHVASARERDEILRLLLVRYGVYRQVTSRDLPTEGHDHRSRDFDRLAEPVDDAVALHTDPPLTLGYASLIVPHISIAVIATPCLNPQFDALYQHPHAIRGACTAWQPSPRSDS